MNQGLRYRVAWFFRSYTYKHPDERKSYDHADAVIYMVTHEILRDLGMLAQVEVEKCRPPIAGDMEVGRKRALLNAARYINEKYIKEREG